MALKVTVLDGPGDHVDGCACGRWGQSAGSGKRIAVAAQV